MGQIASEVLIERLAGWARPAHRAVRGRCGVRCRETARSASRWGGQAMCGRPSSRRSATTARCWSTLNVNPDEPPLPGEVEYKRAKKFAEAFLHEQPRKATIATTPSRDKIEQLKS
jgi:hypothetical protein